MIEEKVDECPAIHSVIKQNPAHPPPKLLSTPPLLPLFLSHTLSPSLRLLSAMSLWASRSSGFTRCFWGRDAAHRVTNSSPIPGILTTMSGIRSSKPRPCTLVAIGLRGSPHWLSRLALSLSLSPSVSVSLSLYSQTWLCTNPLKSTRTRGQPWSFLTESRGTHYCPWINRFSPR